MALIITNLAPSSSNHSTSGIPIIIGGSGWGLSSLEVLFNSTNATVTQVGVTSVSAIIPLWPSATGVRVKVKQSGNFSNTLPFTYT